MALAVIKIVGSFAVFLQGTLNLLGKAFAGVVTTCTAAANAMRVYTFATANGATATQAAAIAMKYFNKSIKLNPIVAFITVILTLITALVGLRSLLGLSSDSLSEMANTDWSNFLDNIKMSDGDLEKFNERLDNTSDGIDDINDELDDTKKKQKGLLSFDEVFKLPEVTNKSSSSGTSALGDTGDLSDLGTFDPSKFDIDPINPEDLLPNLDDLFDWFKNLPWWKLGEYLTKGIASKLTLKPLRKLFQDLLETVGKEFDKFKIKDKINKLAKEVKAGRATWGKEGKQLADSLLTEIEKELGPEKTKKLKIKERLNKLIEDVSSKEKWKNGGKAAAEDFIADLNKAFANAKMKDKPLRTKIRMLAVTLRNRGVDFTNSGVHLSDEFIKGFEESAGSKSSWKAIFKKISSGFKSAVVAPLGKIIDRSIAQEEKQIAKRLSTLSNRLEKKLFTEVGKWKLSGLFDGINFAWNKSTRAGIKGAKQYVKDLEDTLLKSGKKWEKIGERFNFANQVANSFGDPEEQFKYLEKNYSRCIRSLYRSIVRAFGRQGKKVAKQIKLAEQLEKIGALAFTEAETAWAKNGEEALEKLYTSLNKALDKEIQKLDYKTATKYLQKQLDRLGLEYSTSAKNALSLGMARTHAKKEVEKLYTTITKEFGTQGKKVAQKIGLKKKLTDIVVDAMTSSSKEWQKSGRKAVQDLTKELNKALSEEIAKLTPADQVKYLARQLEKAGADVKIDGTKISKGFSKELEKALAGVTISKPEALFKGLAEKLNSKTLFSDLAEKLNPKVLFDSLAQKISQFDGSAILESLKTKLGKIFNPTSIMEFLKLSFKDMGITIIFEILFDQLAGWLDSEGETEAANALQQFGPVVASGLGTAIATKSPWGFVIGAIWGALFEDLGKGLEEGDWSSFINQAVGSLGIILSKIAPKLGIGAAAGPAGWIGAIGSMVSDLIFGTIIDNLRDSGDDQTADILDAIDGAVGGAISGAGVGAVIAGPLGALAGAIIGALVGFLVDNWDQISDWWTNTAVPWFEGLPEKIGGFFSDADQWLSDPSCNPLAGFWDGIKTTWEGIAEFFDGLFGVILGFFTGDETLLTDSGEKMLDGLLTGIKGAFENTVLWFTALPRVILALFTGDDSWLTMNGEEVIQGLLDGIKGAFENVVLWLTALPRAILAFFTGDDSWLNMNGEEIIQGFFDGIIKVWEKVADFFTGILDWIVEHKGPVSEDKKALVPAGEAIINGLFDGIKNIWTNVTSFFTELPNKIKDKFEKALEWLTTAGKNIITGLFSGIKEIWTNVTTFFRELPNKIKEKFDNAVNWLFNAGSNIFKGLKEGITKYWEYIIDFFKNIPNRIKDFFTSAADWLYNAGWNIINGFFDGLKACWSSVAGWISDIGDWIAEHKGPEEYDKQLLIPNGNWIIEGLQEGLSSQFEEAKQLVESFGPQLQNAFAVPALDAGSLVTPSLTVGRGSIPAITQVLATQGTSQEQEVANPFLTNESSQESQKPILYVGTLIADKQGLRELQKKLDVVKTEQDRYQ